MNMHKIRFANREDIPAVQKFIDQYWKKDHVFVRSRELLEWQHLGNQSDFHFVLAEENDQIIALLGYITNQHFDQQLPLLDLWLAIWKVADELKHKGIGFQLYQFLIGRLKPKNIFILGISEQALKVYKALKFKTGVLQHYYYLNPNIIKMNLALVKDEARLSVHKHNKGFYSFEDWDQIFYPEQIAVAPNKSKGYLQARYLKHPSYKYRVITLFENSTPRSILIYREIQHLNSKCLRIVDWIGPFMPHLNTIFEELVSETGAEYIDLLCAYSHEDEILQTGLRRKQDSDIIPNYFEPFVMKNIQVDYAFKGNEHFLICKGDSDQDRPN